MKAILGRRECGCVRAVDMDVNDENVAAIQRRGYRTEIVDVEEKDLDGLLDRDCEHAAT